MSLARVLRVFRKDMVVGPRSPIFMYALVLPVAMTIILQLAFGTLFEPKPRLGLVDEGGSEIPAAARMVEGIDLTTLDDVGELKRQVEANDLDVGLVLPIGFDDAVRAGTKPPLELYMGGESLASNRLILSVAVIDLVRGLEHRAAPVSVELVDFNKSSNRQRMGNLDRTLATRQSALFSDASERRSHVSSRSLFSWRETSPQYRSPVTPSGCVGVLFQLRHFASTSPMSDRF